MAPVPVMVTAELPVAAVPVAVNVTVTPLPAVEAGLKVAATPDGSGLVVKETLLV